MDLNTILFGVYPYIALTVLVVGSVVRFDREQYSWRAGSSQLLRRRQLVLGSNLFHIGVLFILGGHIVGLLTPVWVWDALHVPHSAKQMLAMVSGGLAGLTALAGALLLLHRRLFDARVRGSSSFGDTSVIILLTLQLMLGLGTIPFSAQHLDGSEMVKFMTWAQGVFSFQPNVADDIRDVALVFKAHLLLGMTLLLIFPFTRLVHMLSAPVWYLNRRGWQLVRTKRPLASPARAAELAALGLTPEIPRNPQPAARPVSLQPGE
jgi:nitrate reductase gamma subunit